MFQESSRGQGVSHGLLADVVMVAAMGSARDVVAWPPSVVQHLGCHSHVAALLRL